MKFYFGIIQVNKNGCYYLFRNTIIDNSCFWKKDLLLLSKRPGITFSGGSLGTIHLRRRHFLWGGGVKHLPNLPTTVVKKQPTGGGYGSKIVKICRRLKWMVPYYKVVSSKRVIFVYQVHDYYIIYYCCENDWDFQTMSFSTKTNDTNFIYV